ncbi:hypothetical protein KFL_003890230 [Klebsormidium nitens]|uniref:UFSP1/2/DUB catalytic domain-containing protein n=1 Tax=Klebsormidium nitens TaxID=105231 RepID=A0A1Y1IDC0_KLENI|nr:hypothetical protein KFL_003890230 [Klebsormidium nitens]|eukprot:GAQ87952.1 hypothetical protein KFL_003890230 [Klebsormidium nitens]
MTSRRPVFFKALTNFTKYWKALLRRLSLALDWSETPEVGAEDTEADCHELHRMMQPECSYFQVSEGLMELLQARLAEERGLSRAIIARHVDHFGCLKGIDKGWGCGWRNIQMLLSNLLANEEVRKVFPGEAVVPDIHSLQQWLESAWKHGFDREGAGQLDWKVVNASKWIGTTECAVVLRSLGIRASIVQFDALPATKERAILANGDADALKTTVVTGSGYTDEFKRMRYARCNRCTIGEHYFRRGEKENCNECRDHETPLGTKSNKHPMNCLNHCVSVEAPDCNSTSTSKGGQVQFESEVKHGIRHNKLFGWAWRYFTEGLGLDKDAEVPKECEVHMVDKPPLYFQQQGHSQTIVGVRRVHGRRGGSSETLLLVLDPCVETEELAAMLRGRDRTWRRVLEFGEREFWKPVYHICYVQPGLMTAEELEMSKLLDVYHKE